MGIQINRIKTVLSDHGRTNKWLAEKNREESDHCF